MAYLQRRHRVSERRACRVVGQGRSTQRYVIVPSDFEARLVKEMHVHAEAHPRWGYRKVHALLVDDGWPVNVKRIERLWRAEGLRVPPRRLNRPNGKGIGSRVTVRGRARRCARVTSGPMTSSLRTVDGRPLRLLNVVDEYTRRGVGFDIARSIGARRVKTTLERLFANTAARTDPLRQRQGVHRRRLVTWLAEQGVTAVQVAKASPQQNCYVERFNGSCATSSSTGSCSTPCSKPRS